MGYARVLRDLSTAIARDIKDPEQQPAIMLGTSVPERPNLAFLKSLMLTNGQGTPKFRQLLERFEAGRDPRFLWYPSAGLDFRDLLFLHEVIWKTSWRKEPIRNAQEVPAAPPDIYIHTDCSEPIDYDKWPRILRPFQPLTEHHVPARPFTLYRDDRTNIRIVHHEEISSDIYFPFTKAQRVTPHFQRSPPILPGRFFYFELQVICKQLGEFHRPMLFFFVENAAFLARAILPCHLRVSHVLSIRQQGKAAENVGLCRGYQKHFFKDMRTEVFISDFNPPDCAENHTEGKPTADRKSPQDDYGLSRIAKTSQSVEMSMFATLPEIEWGGDSKYCFQVTTTPKEVTHYA